MNTEISKNNLKKRNKRLTRKIAFLFIISSFTAIVLIVETYAWFIGTGKVKTSSFSIDVSTEENLMLSLNGADWTTDLSLTKETILGTATGTDVHKAYEGNTNHWTGEGTEDHGLIPVSSSGEIDTEASRLKLYQKFGLATTTGGYRISATRVDNYSSTDGTNTLVSEQDGYVAFDLFIKNGKEGYYVEEFNALDNEAIYLTTDSKVEVNAEGEADYGLANSVRVAFVQIGRVSAGTTTAGTITSLTCTGVSGTSTGLCSNIVPTIWEPNETHHDSNLINYFNRICKKKTVTDNVVSYSGACDALVEGTAVTTYTVNDEIEANDNVDIYDGINGFSIPDEYKLTGLETFTDSDKVLTEENRPAFLMLAPNSITKIRVYIYLEGQDVDNYDLISLGKAIKVQFGFTKDQRDLNSDIEES